MILPSNSGWQNLNGILIRLLPSPDARTTLSSLAIKKARNLVPLFVPHYAQVFFSVYEAYSEELFLNLSTEFDDDYHTIYPGEPLNLDISIESGNYKVDLCAFYTWDVNIDTELNNPRYRTFHSALEYTCIPP